jgi:type VI secretion system protein ImpM
MTKAHASATCFGKIPTRGDFVKGTGQHQLIQVLDRWVSQAMERLSENPRWKIAYDTAAPVDFIFAGARSKLSVAGHLRPSSDASGRRFPFIAASTIEREDSLVFRCAPAGLGKSFNTLARICEAGVNGTDVGELLTSLESVNCAADFEAAIQADPLGNFVRHTSLESLASMLQQPDTLTVRRIFLAIGLLMRPILGQGAIGIEKEIVLPLPGDERYRNLVASLWIYLVTAFLRKTASEAQFIIERRESSPNLFIGFNGSTPTTLLSALAPHAVHEQSISLRNPEWIDNNTELTREYGVAKLSAYLAQPALSLEQAIQTFREVFLGE